MKVRVGVVLSLTVVCLALSSMTLAADNAYLFLVHGLPGRDVSATLDPNLPVDVLLNNDLCSERGIVFGAMVGPIALPAGEYNIKISPANLLLPCSNSPIVEANVPLKAGRDTTAIASLDQNGKPTIATFLNDFASVAETEARVELVNAADAPVLTVTLQLVNSNQKYTYQVNPGAKVIASIPSDNYTIEVEANGSVLVPPQPLILSSRSSTLVYAVGEASNGSVSVITKTVKDVL